LFFKLFIFIYLTPNNGGPELGMPSAGTSFDYMIVKSQHIEAKKRHINKVVINKDAKK